MSKLLLTITIGLVLLLAVLGLGAEEKISVEWSLRKLEPICPACSTTVEIKSTKCPKCQKEFVWSEPTFENTPEGSLAKFRYALKYKDEAKLKESILEEKLKETTDWLKSSTESRHSVSGQEFINLIPLRSEAEDKEGKRDIFVLKKAEKSYIPCRVQTIREGEQWKVVPEIVKASTKKMDANHTAAIGSLRTLHAAQATWRQQGASGTGKNDYWTYDVSCFYRMTKGTGVEGRIPLDLARSDARPAKDNVFGEKAMEDWGDNWTPKPKAGYYVMVMNSYNGNEPHSYNNNLLNGVACADDYRFGFCAFPAEYGVTGIYTFIINQCGSVYQKDLGPPPETRPAKKKFDKLSPDDEKQVQELIKQLGVEEWKNREAAQESLIKIGKPAKDILEKAKDSKDPEIRVRVRAILKDTAFRDDLPLPHSAVECWEGTDPTNATEWSKTGPWEWVDNR